MFGMGATRKESRGGWWMVTMHGWSMANHYGGWLWWAPPSP
jgi:hypothetical protein